MPVWGMLTTTGTSLVLASRMWNEAIFNSLPSDRIETLHGVVESMGALLLAMAHAGMHAALTPHIHVTDVRAAAADDEGVHQGIHIMPAQRRRILLNHDQVRKAARLEGAAGMAQRHGAAAAGRRPERRAEAGACGEARAALLPQPLAVFQETQFLDGVDAAVAVRTDGDASTNRHEIVRGEESIAEVGLCDGAEYHRGA